MKENSLTSTISVSLSLLFAASYMFFAKAATAQWNMLQDTDSINSVEEISGGRDLKTMAINLVDGVLTFLGIIAIIMVIYGGVLILMSSGEPEKAQKGKKVIVFAIIGLIVIFFSKVIISTVFTVATGI